MTRAEERALEAYPPETRKAFELLPKDWNKPLRTAYVKGYEQAEKATIERAIAWLKEHANDYILDLTPTYPEAPVELVVGGMCWEHLKEYLENE